MSRAFTRRRFFTLSALAAVGGDSGRANLGATPPQDRRQAALEIRQTAALAQSSQPVMPHLANGDETAFPRWTVAFTKGLPRRAA